MTSKEIRTQARKKLQGNWIKFALITLVIFALALSGQFVGVTGSIVSSLLTIVISLGLTNLYLKFTRDGKFDLKDMICNPKQYLTYFGFTLILSIGTILLILLLVLICSSLFGLGITSIYLAGPNMSSDIITVGITTILSILFVIILISALIGIFVQLYFFAVPYLILDGEGVFSSIGKSFKIIKGHKFKLFKLLLSFIGWHILCVLSLGIGYLFLMPYLNESLTIFYLDLLN